MCCRYKNQYAGSSVYCYLFILEFLNSYSFWTEMLPVNFFVLHSLKKKEQANKYCLKFIKYAVNIEKCYQDTCSLTLHESIGESYFPQTLPLAAMHTNSKMMWKNFYYNKQDLLDMTVWKSNNLFWLETCIFQLL